MSGRVGSYLQIILPSSELVPDFAWGEAGPIVTWPGLDAGLLPGTPIWSLCTVGLNDARPPFCQGPPKVGLLPLCVLLP
jgi:hypothetical protein